MPDLNGLVPNDPAGATKGSAQLADSLLATAERNMGIDWKRREPLQARVKVSCKRVLIQFGSDPKKAEKAADRLDLWPRVQAPEFGGGSLVAQAVAKGSST